MICWYTGPSTWNRSNKDNYVVHSCCYNICTGKTPIGEPLHEDELMPRGQCTGCGFVLYKHEYAPQEWSKKNKRYYCKKCVRKREEAGTPWECSYCGLWKADGAFSPEQCSKYRINTRVCLNCVERRRCKGTCAALKTRLEFTPGEWQHAAKPASTQGRCNDCVLRGQVQKWCAGCEKKYPQKDHFTDHMWSHRGDQERKCRKCTDEGKKGPTDKWCAGCEKYYPQKDHFTDHMWSKRGDTERKCQKCTDDGKRNRVHKHAGQEAETYPCAAPDCTDQHVKKHASAFDKWVLQNFKNHGRTLVCKVCSENGYSARTGGLEKHVCSICGPGGHNKFDKKDLNNKQTRPNMNLRCLKCKKK